MISYKDLQFSLENEVIKLQSIPGFSDLNTGIVQVQISGEHQWTHMGGCETVFETYDDTNAIRVFTKVTNLTQAPLVLEEAADAGCGV